MIEIAGDTRLPGEGSLAGYFLRICSSKSILYRFTDSSLSSSPSIGLSFNLMGLNSRLSFYSWVSVAILIRLTSVLSLECLYGLTMSFPFGWISLQVYSALAKSSVACCLKRQCKLRFRTVGPGIRKTQPSTSARHLGAFRLNSLDWTADSHGWTDSRLARLILRLTLGLA